MLSNYNTITIIIEGISQLFGDFYLEGGLPNIGQNLEQMQKLSYCTNKMYLTDKQKQYINIPETLVIESLLLSSIRNYQPAFCDTNEIGDSLEIKNNKESLINEYIFTPAFLLL